ncbi:hypothetical protein BT67DRAFT_63673 [Trichocladium antarcticum]|uniref:Uncharacterized protein n=1 Tax=Trichocladium antarcticum TaxID=1450529 RepID=A0AAN6UH98_9PEZI|nr:hypothetical protein BT67DRAFT_63673 [Trichocladium antarcticum]
MSRKAGSSRCDGSASAPQIARQGAFPFPFGCAHYYQWSPISTKMLCSAALLCSAVLHTTDGHCALLGARDNFTNSTCADFISRRGPKPPSSAFACLIPPRGISFRNRLGVDAEAFLWTQTRNGDIPYGEFLGET